MRLAQPELDNGSWCWTTPAAIDVGLIGASHASQGGRITNVTCRPKGSGVSSHAGAGSTKRCFGVQSEESKERCHRTRERTAINPLSNACHQATIGPGRSTPNLRSGSTEGPARRASAIAPALKRRGEGPMRRRRRTGSPEPFDENHLEKSQVRL